MLPLPARAKTCFNNTQVRTVQDVELMSDAELLRLPNMGRGTLGEVRNTVAAFLISEGFSGEPSKDTLFIDWCFRHRDILEAIRRGLK